MSFSLQDRYVNLLTDFGFKRVFGNEPHKGLLVDFLNTLLPKHHQIKDLNYKSSENLGKSDAERKAIFDIYCQGSKGERFIVEIQKAKQDFFKDRSIYYASFPIQEQAQKGTWNYRLDPVYSIGVLDFVFDEHKDDPTYLHEVELKDQQCNLFYDKLKFIYVELPKFRKGLMELESHQDKWFYLLRHLPDLGDRPGPFQDSVFLELFEVAEIANFSRNEQETYERSLKYFRDMNNVVAYSAAQGEARGIAIGEQKGIKMGALRQLNRQLSRKFGELPIDIEQAIATLSLAGIDDLSDAVFDLDSIADVELWLSQQPTEPFMP